MHGRQFEYLLFDRNMMNIFNLKNFLILPYFILFYFISLTCLIMDKSFKFKNFVQFAISSFLHIIDPGTWRHCRNSGHSNLRFFILMQSSIILVTSVVKYNSRTNFFRDLISYFELKNGQSFTYVCIFYSLWEIREHVRCMICTKSFCFLRKNYIFRHSKKWNLYFLKIPSK